MVVSRLTMVTWTQQVLGAKRSQELGAKADPGTRRLTALSSMTLACY